MPEPASLTPDMIIVLVVLALVFAGFVTEWRSPEVTALAGAGALIATGTLDVDTATSVFSNPGPLTVGALFVISGALQRTGVIDVLSRNADRLAALGKVRAQLVVMVAILVVSAVINNTPVVMVMTPVIIALAARLDTVPSRLLIPLSYASVLGGACTIIGTSTNLIINGVVQQQGMEPFGIFEITLPGLVMGVVGIVYVMLTSDRLLPEREPLASASNEESERDFVTELFVPEESELDGKRLEDTDLYDRDDVTILEILRADGSEAPTGDLELADGDRLVLQSNAGNVLELREMLDPRRQIEEKERHDGTAHPARLAGFQPISHKRRRIVEGMVGPDSQMRGERIGDLNLGRAGNINILGLHRQGEDVEDFGRERLEFGDVLLLQAPVRNLEELFDQRELVNLGEPRAQTPRRGKRPIALLAAVSVVGLAAFDVLPIVALALLGAIAVMLFRCIEPDEAYRTIDWRILFLIFGMLAIGRAMETTGTAAYLVNHLADAVRDFGPWVILAAVYATASLMTETITNNAVAVIMTPLVIGLAEQVGVDPRPFVVAVMFAASASFATPLGYQTNTIVYGAGNYRFSDFLRIGLPLNILIGAVAVLLIPVFWPFAG